MHLPDECLFLIFQRLDNSSDRNSFGLTCHRWLQVQNSCRKSLQVYGSHQSQATSIFNSVNLYKLLQRFRELESLSLTGCMELPDSILAEVQSYGTKLRTLRLDGCSDTSDYGFSLAVSSCSFLTLISLDRCKISDDGLHTVARSCKMLKDVSISFCRRISDSGIKSLMTYCHQLRSVRASHCSSVSGIGFEGCPQSLTHLDVGSCRLEPEGIQGILSGGGLEYLNVSGRTQVVHGDDLAFIGAGLGSRLRTLNFRLCRTVGDLTIMVIARGCPLLQEWNLVGCDEIRFSGWDSIGSNCKNLERLHVNRCRNLCEPGLRAIRDGCPRLSVLHINRCPRIPNAALELFRNHREGVEIDPREVLCIAPTCISPNCREHQRRH